VREFTHKLMIVYLYSKVLFVIDVTYRIGTSYLCVKVLINLAVIKVDPFLNLILLHFSV